MISGKTASVNPISMRNTLEGSNGMATLLALSYVDSLHVRYQAISPIVLSGSIWAIAATRKLVVHNARRGL